MEGEHSNLKILILGGTGAMGVPLVEALAKQDVDVTVTSRTAHISSGNIKYIQGNAKDINFTRQLMKQRWDSVIDFMNYGTKEFRERIDILLSNTKQYVFISSARVYAQSEEKITENTPRLLDISDDKEYLSTDEYALAKARCEDLLNKSGKQNWTIIRPSITYNVNRLQLGVLEKENWLYRAIRGRSIVFSKDIADKLTAMTLGSDVAKGIISIIGQEKALGEVFHIVEPHAYAWSDILEIYLDVIEEKTGKRPQVVMTDKTTCFAADWAKYQIIYCRYYNRRFDSSKIGEFVDINSFTDVKNGLRFCLMEFLNNMEFRKISWRLEGINDRVTGEWANISEIKSLKDKVVYLLYRLGLGKICGILWRIIR